MMKTELLKKEILNKCVKLHLKKGKPIGSKLLKKKCFKEIGESTLRWYLNKLTREGYLENVENFAGRVPTDFGWRCYLDWNLDKINIKKEDIAEFKNKDFVEISWRISKKLKIYYLIQEYDQHITEGGLENILENIEFEEEDRIKKFANFLKTIKLKFNELVKQTLDDSNLSLFIGQELPIKIEEAKLFSVIIKKHNKNVVCFISLKRINYPYVVKLIEKVLNG